MKKTIRILTLINRILVVLTSLLFVIIITFYFGLILEIILGGCQVLTAFILLIFWKHLSVKERKRLIIYFFLIVVYFTTWVFVGFQDNLDEIFEIFFWIVLIPMSLAFYLTFTLEKIKDRLK